MRRTILWLIAALALLPVEGRAETKSTMHLAAGGYMLSWDSESITSGDPLTSSLLNLVDYKECELWGDNTAGLAFRDVTLISFAPDGVTTIGQKLLRKAAWGTAPTGSSYAPGLVQGYIGPNPPGGTSGVVTFFDASTAASTSINTGPIFVEEAASLQYQMTCTGGTAALLLWRYEDDGTSETLNSAAAAGSSRGAIGIGIGSSNQTAAVLWSAHVPRRVQVSTGVCTGTANRVLVTGRGQLPGIFSVQMVLPPRAKLQIAAASGTARFWLTCR